MICNEVHGGQCRGYARFLQEQIGAEFVDDNKIFASGLITKENVASITPDRFSEADNRLFTASAAINGA